MKLFTRSIGVQWAWDNFIFSPHAFCANAGGNHFVKFQEGALLRAYAWQSSVKTPEHEVLLHFVISPEGTGLGEPGEVAILSTHHIGGSEPTMIVKTLTFPLGHWLEIPKGWVAWIYGEGAGPTHPAPVEVQTMLYCTALEESSSIPQSPDGIVE